MVGKEALRQSNPLKYSERTVSKATRRLQGVIDTPVTER
jgi:hypothetical protein